MAADTLDDLTQSLETDTEDCNLPPSNHIKDSIYLCEYKEKVLTDESTVTFKKSQWTQLKRKIKHIEKMISETQEKFSERSKTKSQLRHYKVECYREPYGGRLEGEKQNRERLQTKMDHPSCVSSALHDHEHPTSKLNIQQLQDEFLPLKDKLLIHISKAENERYQLCNCLREKTLMLEITQRKLNQVKAKIKKYEDQIRTENEKLNRSFLREESMPEGLTHMQRENKFLRKPFKDDQNKGVFKVGTSNCVLMLYKNSFMPLNIDTGKLDMIEEQNEYSVDEYNHLRKKLHKLEKEKAKRMDAIRKLQQKLANFQKELFMTSKSMIYEEILKQEQLQKESDESKRKLQESQEKNKQKQQYFKELEDYTQMLKMKRATFEESIKQQKGKNEKIQENTLCSPLVECLKKQLDERISKNRYLEQMNIKLKEEIMKSERLDLECHLERLKLKYNQVEQYRPKIKVQVKQAPEEQIDRDNLFLQIRELEAEVLKMQISHQETKAKLERCTKDFSQEYRFSTNSFVDPLHDIVLDNYMDLFGRNSKYFFGETETSINGREACFAQMQQDLENPVTTIDDAIAELPSTSYWASPMGYTRRPNLNWDPVSRPTQEYLGGFKKIYMF